MFSYSASVFLTCCTVFGILDAMVAQGKKSHCPAQIPSCGCNALPVVAVNYTAKSCLDHMKHGASRCGYYVIEDGVERYTVFCDINSEVGAAYTLIESFSLQNNRLFKFQSLTQNFPANHNSPRWDFYRLTKDRMARLAKLSTHWRATCNFPQVGIDYRDYVRVHMSKLNPITFQGNEACINVELIQIRGRLELHRTVAFWQRNFHLHHDSSFASCQMKATPKAVSGEDDWGYYSYINPEFRCTSSPQSTTQFWFGSYL